MSKPETTITPEVLRLHASSLDPSGHYWVCGVLESAADEIERLLRIETAARKAASRQGGFVRMDSEGARELLKELGL